MTNPLTRERDELTTADIVETAAQPAEAEIQRGQPKRVQSERTQTEHASPEALAVVSQRDPNEIQLIAEGERADLRSNWDRIQAGFVDEPRKAVEEADSLVASAVKQLAESFARERANLEQQWDHGGNVSTEDLRLALQRYRSFFHRLLAT